LFTKEFSASTAPEVGRIIDIQNLPSTVYLVFLSNNPKQAFPLYIEGIARAGSVEDYLQANGIQPRRLAATGYVETPTAGGQQQRRGPPPQSSRGVDSGVLRRGVVFGAQEQ